MSAARIRPLVVTALALVLVLVPAAASLPAPALPSAAGSALTDAQGQLERLAALRDAGPTPWTAYVYAREVASLPHEPAAVAPLDARTYLAGLAPGADLSALDELPPAAYDALSDVLAVHRDAALAAAARAPVAELEALRAALVLAIDGLVELTASLRVSGAPPVNVCGAVYLHLGDAPDTIACDHVVSVAGFGSDVYTNRAGGAGAGEASLAIDLGGDDAYLGNHTFETGVNGGGFRGFGALVDLGGDDVYDAGLLGADGSWRPQGSLNGGGRNGAGLLVDVNGSDTYHGWISNGGVNGGASFGGSGALLDLGGRDERFSGIATALSGGVNGGSNDGNGLFFHCGSGTNTYSGRVQERGGVNGGGEQGNAVFVSCGGAFSRYAGVAGGGGVNGAGSGEQVANFVHLEGDGVFEGHVRYGGVNGGAFRALAHMVVGPGDHTYTASLGEVGGLNGGAVVGTGVLVDVSGNDHYRASAAGAVGANGGALFGGLGLLVDADGHDTYETAIGGAPHPGFGAGLPPHTGRAVNGHGREGGCGLLVDLAGSDAYRDDPSSGWEHDTSTAALPPACGARVDA